MNKRAVLIAFEGVDGSGKGTQADILMNELIRQGLRTEIVSFPRYGKTAFSEKIAKYLNGDYGSIYSLPPEFPVLLYAGDRFESKSELFRLMENNDVIILDRYVSSNLAYQSAKLPEDKVKKMMSWIVRLEYELYKLPPADITIFLDVGIEKASEMIQKKSPREYTNKKADLHEENKSYLERCSNIYKELAEENFYSQWVVIDCHQPNGKVKTKDEIALEIKNNLKINELLFSVNKSL